MKIFIDTAKLDEIKEAERWGIIDGVTTNPTLLKQAGADLNRNWKDMVIEICKIIDGPVSLEAMSDSAINLYKEGVELFKIHPNVVVKIPMTIEGLAAVRSLNIDDIPTNVTLVFSAEQALLAMKAGATYISPFLGRIDDSGGNSLAVLNDILTIKKRYNYKSKILAASIRSPEMVKQCAILGVDAVTVPFIHLKELSYHPLTDKGLDSFKKDWDYVSK
jgi:transaldolase